MARKENQCLNYLSALLCGSRSLKLFRGLSTSYSLLFYSVYLFVSPIHNCRAEDKYFTSARVFGHKSFE